MSTSSGLYGLSGSNTDQLVMSLTKEAHLPVLGKRSQHEAVVYDGGNLQEVMDCFVHVLDGLGIGYALTKEPSHRITMTSFDTLVNTETDKDIDDDCRVLSVKPVANRPNGTATVPLKLERSIKPERGTLASPSGTASEERKETNTEGVDDERGEQHHLTGTTRGAQASSSSSPTPARPPKAVPGDDVSLLMGMISKLAKQVSELTTKVETKPGSLDSVPETAMADAMIAQSLNGMVVFYYDGKAESESNRNKRIRAFQFFKSLLGDSKSLADKVRWGDIRALFLVLHKDSTKNSTATYLSTSKLLSERNKKKEEGFDNYERALQKLFALSAQAGVPISDRQKTAKLVSGMHEDGRYKQKIETCEETHGLTYQKAVTIFRNKARKIENLHTVPSRQPKKAEANATTNDRSRGNNNKESKEACRHYAEGKCTRGDSCPYAHVGTAGGRQNSRSSERGHSKGKKPVCPYFLEGKCNKGKNCKWQHVKLNKSTRRGDSSGSDSSSSSSNKSNLKKGGTNRKVKFECFAFRDTGKCHRGDDCSFAHVKNEGTSANNTEEGESHSLEAANALGFTSTEALNAFLDKYGYEQRESHMISASTIPSEHKTVRGPHHSGLTQGMTVVICMPNTTMDARLAQVVAERPPNRYALQLIDEKGVPRAILDTIATNGLRADDIYLVTQGDWHRASDSCYDGVSLNSELLAYMAKAVVDSGADGQGYCNLMSLYDRGSVRQLDRPISVKGPYGRPSVLRYCGDITIQSNTKAGSPVHVQCVPYAPHFARTLVSVPMLDDCGYYCDFGGGGLRIREGASPDSPALLLLPRAPERGSSLEDVPVGSMPRTGAVVFPTNAPNKRHNLYPIPDVLLSETEGGEGEVNLTQSTTCGEALLAKSYYEGDELRMLHDRLAHTADSTIVQMLLHDGRTKMGSETLKRAVRARWCTWCGIGKSHESPYDHKCEHNDTDILAYVSADLRVAKGESVHGFTSYLAITERKSSKHFVFLLRRRGEASAYFLWWMRYAHTLHHPHKIKNLYIDGGEIRTNQVKEECKLNGTRMLPNLRSQHKQNPIGENTIKILDEAERTARARGNAPDAWWEFSLIGVVEAKGVVPPRRALSARTHLKDGSKAPRPLTPNEIWFKRKYDSYSAQIERLIPSFCLVVAHTNKEMRDKKTDPGFVAIYLCPIHESLVRHSSRIGPVVVRDGSVETQRGHIVLKCEDLSIHHVRTVRPNLSFYPMAEGWGHLTKCGWTRQRFQNTASEPEQATGSANEPHRLTLPQMLAHRDAAAAASQAARAAAPSSSTELSKETPLEEPVEAHLPMPDAEQEPPGSMAAWMTPMRNHNPSNANQSMPALEVLLPAETETQAETEPPVPSLTPEQQIGRTDIERLNAALENSLGTEEPAVPHMQAQPILPSKPPMLSMPTPKRLAFEPMQPRRSERLAVKGGHPEVGSEVLTAMGYAMCVDTTDGDVSVASAAIDGNPLARYKPSYDSWSADRLPPKEPPPWPVSPFGPSNLCTPIMGEAQLAKVKSCPKHTRSKFEGVSDPWKLIDKVKAHEVDLDIPPDHHLRDTHPLYPLVMEAKQKELEGLCARGTFGPPQALPAGAKAIDVMWVSKAKGHQDGPLIGLLKKVKERLTMMGNMEKNVLTKMQAYAPVAHRATYLVVLATYISRRGVKFHQLDVVQAYLTSKMKREVYVRHPKGFELFSIKGKMYFRRLLKSYTRPTSVMRLMLALYGGMECGRLFWHGWVSYHVDSLGFTQVHCDQCVLIKHEGDEFIVLVFHVDDSQVAQCGDKLWNWYLKNLKIKFEYTLGPLSGMLGMRIKIDYDRRIISIDQELQARKMLSAFGMDNTNLKTARAHCPDPGKMPAPTKGDVPTDKKELAQAMSVFDMPAAVGHMNYLAVGSRPDIELPLKHLSPFMRAWGDKHIQYAKHLMRYIAGSVALPLIIRSGYKLGVQIFTDASHASNSDSRRSVLAVVIKVAGNTVMWCCLYSKIVAHSSCESELMALDKGATMGQFIKWLVELMGQPEQGPIDIFVDNQSTIDITTNPVQPGRNLHVHARYFYVRDLVFGNTYSIWHLASKEMVADMLVSFKGRPNFDYLLPLLMGCAQVEQIDGKHVWNTSLLL